MRICKQCAQTARADQSAIAKRHFRRLANLINPIDGMDCQKRHSRRIDWHTNRPLASTSVHLSSHFNDTRIATITF